MKRSLAAFTIAIAATISKADITVPPSEFAQLVDRMGVGNAQEVKGDKAVELYLGVKTTEKRSGSKYQKTWTEGHKQVVCEIEKKSGLPDPDTAKCDISEISIQAATRLAEERGYFMLGLAADRRLLSSPWPRHSFKKTRERTVRIRFEVTSEGRIQNTSIEQTSGSTEVDKDALTLFETWRFFPKYVDQTWGVIVLGVQ